MISEDVSFCLSLIGKPWVSGAIGPAAFDCWGLIRHVFQERRGLTLCPFAGVRELGLAGMMRTAEKEADEHWERIPGTSHLALVAMGRGRRIEHVGLWLDEGGGGVFHSNEATGVVFQGIASVRSAGPMNFTFYQHKSWLKF